MKKHKKSVILVIILAIIAAFLLLTNSEETFKKQSNIFSVTDTTSVTKFFLADKNNNTVKVERSSTGAWILNDKYEVNPTMVQVMLLTFSEIDIKAPVAKSMRNTVIRMMAGKSVKTEIYQRVYRINIFNKIKLFPHEKLVRTYYVGDVTMDNSGTFMLMEGSEDPYIVNIPGFKGFVASRYSAIEGDWHSHSVFRYRVPDIKSVSVKYKETPQQSFVINNDNNHIFTVEPLMGKIPAANIDTTKVLRYLSLYRNLNYESLLDDMSKTKRDSILATAPTCEITLLDRFGKSHTLAAWKRKAEIGQLDNKGNQLDWDIERMYAHKDNDEYMVVIQYFVFSDVMAPLQWFVNQ